MNSRYTKWCLTFTDLKERKTYIDDEENMIAVEEQLDYAFKDINTFSGLKSGIVETYPLRLIREGSSYEYILYILVEG